MARSKAWLIGAALSLLLLASPGRAADEGATAVRIALNFTWQSTYAPLRYGESKGRFKDEKLALDIVPTQGGDQALQLLATGKVDYAFTDSDTFLTATAQGKITATAIYVWLDVSSLGIAAMTPIEGPKALAGKSFGTTVFSAGRTIVPYILGQHGVDPASLKVQTMDFSVLMPTFFRGELDTVQVNDPGSWQNILVQAKKQRKTLHLARLAEWGLVGYDKMLIVGNTVLRNSPAAVARVVRALDRARSEATAQASDAEIFALMKPVMPQADEAPLVADWNDYKMLVKKPGPIDPAVFETTLARLKAVGAINNVPPVAGLYNNQVQ
jgi:ABC-type nitrate/sulfonate/bicarbonate transport system substrate-binding protein